jgi:hypothetical protein
MPFARIQDTAAAVPELTRATERGRRGLTVALAVAVAGVGVAIGIVLAGTSDQGSGSARLASPITSSSAHVTVGSLALGSTPTVLHTKKVVHKTPITTESTTPVTSEATNLVPTRVEAPSKKSHKPVGEVEEETK